MKIGIIGAMQQEIKLLLKKMKIQKVNKKAGTLFFQGRLYNHSVIICKSGIGKVNAAKATQILISKYGADVILFTGVAGGLRSNLRRGDIVISSTAQQYDVNFSAIGFPPGNIPQEKRSIFPANPFLIKLAVKASMLIKVRFVKGKILTGDQFIANPKVANLLRKKFHGAAVETEGAAVAQVSFRNKIPFVIIRGISDKAGREAPEDFSKLLQLIANRPQRIVLIMLKILSKRKPC